MLEPPLPSDEQHRLQVLLNLNLLDTEPEERFDRITRMAARLFQVPVALVGLIDAEREWFKSRVGIAEHETARRSTFCAHAILQDATLVVEDALEDQRFADNPLVTSGRVRFYAGAPLAAPDGSKVGTLCLIDSAPRRFDEEQRSLLRDLAAVVAHEFASDELQRALQQQRDSETWLRALLDNLPEGVLMLDEEARVLSANAAAGALFGTDPGHMAGRGLQSLVVESIAAPLASASAGQVLTHQVTGRRDDGASFPLDLYASAVVLGGRRRFAAIVRDAAPRLEQAWRIRAAGERRHKTFTSAAHEMRTPLASILGFSELLLKRDFDADTGRELLDIVHGQASLLASVVTQTMELARIEAAGRPGLRIVPLAPAPLLADALANLDVPGQEGRVSIDCDAALPPLAADAYYLTMALRKVISNALAYSGSGTPVTVRARRDPAPGTPALLIDIRDEGIGMPLEQRERIFEPFYRAHGAPTADGTGLGMAIVQEIVALHNGSIDILSALGAGTTVSLRLPVASEDTDD